ncbi:MAG: hypothetical protein IJU90_03755 [Bacteroidales bacterium]|nr:hypothetical protein [Bacteroidales bacterium]
MNKVVAYLDLLGFSECVQNDLDEAIMMLSHSNTILKILISDRILHPSESYDCFELQNLARRTSIESFDGFKPFSDSAFITSDNCSEFVMQLGNFVLKAFQFNADCFAYPENSEDPTISHYVGMESSSPNKIHTVCVECHEHPVLFRGGLAYGNVIETKQTGLSNGQKTDCFNLMGDAVVRAVSMEYVGKASEERKIKGPRLVFDESVYKHLSDDVKLYCRPLPENESYYEILWPAMGYILENKHSFEEEICHFHELFDPAYNLWRFYKKNNPKVAVHYEKFLELIVSSAIQLYKYVGMEDFIMQKIKVEIKNKYKDYEMDWIFNGCNLQLKN